ncbi:LLM class F420-dependent oxidoreductase [Knoellia koreensis]|uniref:LLM class F420-dependent oxidoreductase n=1 Tax=Knoellia koreensis TaxID=2730921 RepID=A0A849HGN4_9MICO|nr:LLM class F420-dependent oxidoreductase [Knoellia sp. DB2414S]NNM46412.1 LLM class F420-dependent oxidoreductase [Knoellia sp. DB2414S]
MKFGLFIPQGWKMDLVGIEPSQHWGVMAGLARRADANEDWSSVWVYDHFHTVPVPSEEATHEAWTLMSAFAGVTGRVRLGQMCTCMSYRNPAYLAKVAATVDIVSEGRLEMGIGAGWYEDEWRAYGYGFPRAGERLARLDEGVQIFRQMWTEGRSTFSGKHYTTEGARCYPQPLQGTAVPGSAANGIPMWIAGGGEKVTLRIAAQYADYTNFGAGVAADFAAKSEVLAARCSDVGRDYDEITRSTNLDIFIGATERDVADRIAWLEDHMRRAGVPDKELTDRIEGIRRSPGTGTPEQIVERLRELEGLGMKYLITYFYEAAYDTTGIAMFERDVMPELTDREQHGHLWHLGRR